MIAVDWFRCQLQILTIICRCNFVCSTWHFPLSLVVVQYEANESVMRLLLDGSPTNWFTHSQVAHWSTRELENSPDSEFLKYYGKTNSYLYTKPNPNLNRLVYWQCTNNAVYKKSFYNSHFPQIFDNTFRFVDYSTSWPVRILTGYELVCRKIVRLPTAPYHFPCSTSSEPCCIARIRSVEWLTALLSIVLFESWHLPSKKFWRQVATYWFEPVTLRRMHWATTQGLQCNLSRHSILICSPTWVPL